MKRSSPYTFVLFFLMSCGASEKPSGVHVVTQTKKDTVVNEYSEAGFISGYWIKDKTLAVVAEGDLNFNTEWSHIKTFTKQNQPVLLVEDPLDVEEYALILDTTALRFALTSPNNGSCRFSNDTLTMQGDTGVEQYVLIDPGEVIYKYYFAGKYYTLESDSQMMMELTADRDLVGWPEATSYEAHDRYEKPVFVVKNGDLIKECYYIQDYNGGFQLFEIKNRNADLSDATIEIGKLKYTLIKS